jgi:hypothetical protein
VPAKVTIESVQPHTKRVTAAAGISHHGTHTSGNEVWLVANAYTDAVLYETVYVVLGETDRVLVEDQGVLPTMFAGPDNAVWAVVTNPYGSRDREIIRPVGGPPGKPFAPFVGEPLWMESGEMLFVNTDAFSSTKPDRWLRYHLTKGVQKIVKLPLPNKGLYLRNEEGIHGLARTQHRLYDPKGKVLRERALGLDGLILRPIELRFDGRSELIGTDSTTLWWLTVDPDGSVERSPLMSGSFYNLWPVQSHASGAVAVRHNGEQGNGWAIARDGQLLTSVRSDEHGYVDSTGRRTIELPAGSWILSGLEMVGNDLAVIAYDRPSQGNRADALWISRVSCV